MCGADGACEHDTLELLAGLVDKSMVMVRSVTDRTRYGVLETLRAFGRERLHEHGTQIGTRCGMRCTTASWPSAPRWACRVSMSGTGSSGCCPTTTTCARRSNRRWPTTTSILRCDWSRRYPSCSACASATRWRDWAERVVAVADPDHPLFAAAVGTAARGAWTRGDFSRARSLAALADGRVPGRGSARMCYPGDVLVDAALFEGDAQHALAYWDREVARARRDGDPIRLV